MSSSTLMVLWILGGVGGTCALVGLIFLSIRSITYRLTATHLKVTWFGVPLRRVRLDDIRHIGNKPVFLAESWASAPFTLGRLLVIRRKRGLFRNFVITPVRPYEFRFRMFQAIKALTGESLRATEWELPASISAAGGPQKIDAETSSQDVPPLFPGAK
jgi:hypothetical protein